METRWLYHTSETFPTLVEESKGVCVIPMGCVEKHGLHLPLGTDCFEATETAYRASQLETVCVFPDFIFGDVPEAWPSMPAGTITLPVETEMLLLEQLCEQASRNGFKKILVVNGHGGNTKWLSTFLRKLTNKKRDFVCGVYSCSSSKSVNHMAEHLIAHGSGSVPEITPEDEQVVLDFHNAGKTTGHACMGETACVLGCHPETVHLERLGIESGLSLHKTDYLKEVGIEIKDHGWGINHPYAFSGHDPEGCNERIGRAALRMQAERLARALKVYKDDENVLKWHEEAQKGW